MGRTILSEYSATGASYAGRGEWEEWRGEEAGRARREEMRDRRLTMGREHSETRPQAQGRAMRKEDVRWELERERRRMEDHDVRAWQLDRMIDAEVEKARQEGKEQRLTMLERLWLDQARHMKDMDQRRKRQEEGRQDEKEDDVIDDEVAPTDVDEEEESEAGEAGEVVEVVEESMAEVVEAEGKEGGKRGTEDTADKRRRL